MSLTGPGLLWFLGVLAVALFVAIVSGWPRRGPTTPRIAGRAVPVLLRSDHPNASGHARLADAVIDALQSNGWVAARAAGTVPPAG